MRTTLFGKAGAWANSGPAARPSRPAPSPVVNTLRSRCMPVSCAIALLRYLFDPSFIMQWRLAAGQFHPLHLRCCVEEQAQCGAPPGISAVRRFAGQVQRLRLFEIGFGFGLLLELG